MKELANWIKAQFQSDVPLEKHVRINSATLDLQFGLIALLWAKVMNLPWWVITVLLVYTGLLFLNLWSVVFEDEEDD